MVHECSWMCIHHGTQHSTAHHATQHTTSTITVQQRAAWTRGVRICSFNVRDSVTLSFRSDDVVSFWFDFLTAGPISICACMREIHMKIWTTVCVGNMFARCSFETWCGFLIHVYISTAHLKWNVYYYYFLCVCIFHFISFNGCAFCCFFSRFIRCFVRFVFRYFFFFLSFGWFIQFSSHFYIVHFECEFCFFFHRRRRCRS